MKRTVKIIVLAIVFGIFFVFPAAAQKTKSDFQKMYMTFLNQKKYSPVIDDDGDIVFNYNGDNYIIIVNEKNPQLFEMFYPLNVSNYPMQKAVNAANFANRNSDVVTVYVLPDGKTAIISVGLLLLKPKDFQTLFPKILGLIDDALENFKKEIWN